MKDKKQKIIKIENRKQKKKIEKTFSEIKTFWTSHIFIFSDL